MRVSNKLRLAALALTSGLVLGGCAYGFGDPYGSYGGLGVGYGNYGYGNYGYGYGYPYSGYGYGYGSPYGGYGNYIGYGYGGYPYGWNDGWYYPGSGYYVYDTSRHRRQITDAERQYWRDKFDRYRTSSRSTVSTTSVAPRENWSAFKRVRTRTVDTSDATTSRGSDHSRWNRSSTTTSSSSSSTRSDSRSSDFMDRHSPRRSKD